MKPVSKLATALVLLAAALGLAATTLLLLAPAAIAATGGPSGAALATGLSSLGAGFAVAKVGAAAVGALAEKPELFARLLIFVGLAEGIAIYGLIVSILIMNRLTG